MPEEPQSLGLGAQVWGVLRPPASGAAMGPSLPARGAQEAAAKAAQEADKRRLREENLRRCEAHVALEAHWSVPTSASTLLREPDAHCDAARSCKRHVVTVVQTDTFLLRMCA